VPWHYSAFSTSSNALHLFDGSTTTLLCVSLLIIALSLCADSAHVPHFVESLAGRVHVTATALGRQHTLFLDSSGQAWATGENREGQCGLGTPPEEAARKQRRQFEGGAFASWQPGGPAGLPTAAAAAAGSGGSAAQRQQSGSAAAAAQSYEQQQFERSVEWFSQNAWQTTNLKPFLEYRQRAEELAAAVSM
jgi:hypothetical protein